MALVLTEIRDGVALLTLNNPDERNTMTSPMVDEIVAAMDAFEADESVGAIVVTGAGYAFCAGANLGNLQSATRESLGKVYEGFLRIARSPLPTLAAVNGPAVGAGMNLALGCDVRIAAHRARFDTRFLQIGLHPGGGHTWMQRRIVGQQNAMAAVVFSQVLDGPEAERVGSRVPVGSGRRPVGRRPRVRSRRGDRPTSARDHDEADDPRHGRHRHPPRRRRARVRAPAVDGAAALVRGADRRAQGEDLQPASAERGRMTALCEHSA